MRLDDDEALQWLARDVPTLIVAGAGLSRPAPAQLPGVAPFLSRTTRLLETHASYSPTDNAYVDRLFPEACYGILAEVYGSRAHLDMWTVLSPDVAAAVGASPNLGHHMVVHLAATRGWPILTTNFDCFIEEAARARGVPVTTEVPRLHQKLRVGSSAGGAAVVKVHGTAQDTTSIRATSADLSRSARIVRRLRFDVPPRRALILGYSGRDLDVFPWLAERFTDILWIDVCFPEAHHARTLGVLRWQGSADLLARMHFGVRPVTPPDDPAIDRAYDARTEVAVTAAVTPLVSRSRGDAEAALVGVLSATGSHADAARLGDRGRTADTTPDAQFQALMWRAGALASLDRYTEARDVARAARRTALAMVSPRRLGRASIALAYAATAREWLALPLPRAPGTVADRLRRLTSLAAVFWTTAVYAPLAVLTLVQVYRSERPAIAKYRFVCEYLEHWVRLGALLDRLRRAGPPVAAILDFLWLVLERMCLSTGYTEGVLNTGRYRSRGQGTIEGANAALTRARMVGHSIALAIAYRDAAEELARRALPGPPPTSAIALLDKALEFAKLAESPSLLLKVHLLRRRFGLGGPLPLATVDTLVAAADCPAIKRQRDAAVAALT